MIALRKVVIKPVALCLELNMIVLQGKFNNAKHLGVQACGQGRLHAGRGAQGAVLYLPYADTR